MSSCHFCHEGCCIAREELNDKEFICKGMNKKNLKNKSIVIECIAKEEDLIECCEDCEINPVDEKYWYLGDYCTKCAEERVEQDKKDNIEYEMEHTQKIREELGK